MMKNTAILLIMLLTSALLVVSCSSPSVTQTPPSVSPQTSSTVSSDLAAAKSQIADLQGKLTQTQGQNDTLSKQFAAEKTLADGLQAKYDALNAQFITAGKDNTALQAKYDDLNKQYEALKAGTAPQTINPQDVEQAIFNLVNAERKSRGIAELAWGINVYGWATQNSKAMAAEGKIEASSSYHLAYQDAFWATGYDTKDRMANAAVTVWKANARFEFNFLSNGTKYGAVAVYKSGDIYYITWVADFFR
jgi:uncharacterized protein YkwD